MLSTLTQHEVQATGDKLARERVLPFYTPIDRTRPGRGVNLVSLRDMQKYSPVADMTQAFWRAVENGTVIQSVIRNAPATLASAPARVNSKTSVQTMG
jgi:hypothetical protein